MNTWTTVSRRKPSNNPPRSSGSSNRSDRPQNNGYNTSNRFNSFNDYKNNNQNNSNRYRNRNRNYRTKSNNKYKKQEVKPKKKFELSNQYFPSLGEERHVKVNTDWKLDTELLSNTETVIEPICSTPKVEFNFPVLKRSQTISEPSYYYDNTTDNYMLDIDHYPGGFRDSPNNNDDILPIEFNFENPLCSINCFNCNNIDSLKLNQVFQVCPCGYEEYHDNCYLCIHCVYKYQKINTEHILRLIQRDINVYDLEFYTPCNHKIDITFIKEMNIAIDNS